MAAPLLIQVYNRQRKVGIDMAWVRRFAEMGLAECLQGEVEMGLEGVGEIEVSLVSDRVIARVHRRFMKVPGATDVITFEHGEIVVSAETAARYAREHGGRVETEVGLYIIHGILHLNGYDDLEEPAATRMRERQAEITERVMRSMRGSLSAD